MHTWFISDTHFSHTNIIRYTGRPFQSIDEMNECLIDNWNALIAPEDSVFFLGDFDLGNTDFLAGLCKRLQGNKTCIRGNHDGSPMKMQKIGFMIVLESTFVKIGRHKVELIHVPSFPALSHFQLHGHVHEKRSNKLIGTQLNLSVEVWGYKPVSEKTIVALLDHSEHGFQIGSISSKALENTTRTSIDRESDQGCSIQGRRRSEHRRENCIDLF